MIIGEYLDYSK